MQRPSNRQANDLRDIKFTRHYTMHAEGSVLVEFGNPDKSYNGPVTFSPANVGYYVEELGNVNDELEDVASDMLSAVLDDDKDVKVRFTLTDFDPDDFGPIVFADFGDGTFALYQAIEK